MIGLNGGLLRRGIASLLPNFGARIESDEKIMTRDGAWCWFQDPRAVYVSGKRTRTYAQWVTQDGRLQIGAYDHKTGETEIHTLENEWGRDDHNVGAFIVLPDRRLFIFYARHEGKGIFCRASAGAEDISEWEDVVTISTEGRISYAHPVYLSEEKKFYVFWRARNWKPAFATSTDGKLWSDAATFIQDGERAGIDIRPYTKIASDDRTTIHFAFTDGHPRNESRNSVYYVRYERGNLFKADGNLIGMMNDTPIPHRKSDMIYNGATQGRAWIWDIALDDNGFPVIAYTRLPDETNHRYCYARWTGETWLNKEITPGGRWFPQTSFWEKEREPHYSGGMALDHSNPSLLYISRQVKGTFEIEQWESPDKGKTWRSLPVTGRSRHLNIRPVVPRGYDGEIPHVLWMFGDYRHYTNYKTGIKLLHRRK